MSTNFDEILNENSQVELSFTATLIVAAFDSFVFRFSQTWSMIPLFLFGGWWSVSKSPQLRLDIDIGGDRLFLPTHNWADPEGFLSELRVSVLEQFLA